MWRVGVMLLLALLLKDSFQDSGYRYNATKNATFHPKTFSGRMVMMNDTEFLNLSIHQPVLNVSNKVFNHTAGFLSTRIIPTCYVLAILIGIPSNIFVLACLSGKSKLSGGILYISLAGSDLLLLVSLTLRVHYHFNNNSWAFGELACKIVTACFYGNIYCSIHAHMCISLMRYLAVVHPFLYRGLSKRYCAIWASLSVWVVFAIALTPEFLVQQTYRISGQNIITCHDVQSYDEKSYLIPYRLSLICLGFILPSLVIIFVYGSILHHLNRSRRDWNHYIKASTLMFGIFLLCFTPSSIIHFLHYVRLYTQDQDDLYHYFRVAVCLCSLHGCLDPFLSYVLTKTLTSQPKFRSFRCGPLKASSIVQGLVDFK
ncbi:proteinase-activated receptor 3 [Triplophysa rosa]|uniref:proteinase-activated receptor 3 n=1 Tax=Triplophysa rosa TaxID=992332 RepID=UPI002545EE02|nr:proteinase-activated receptor 3 [Triplophysa rosa]